MQGTSYLTNINALLANATTYANVAQNATASPFATFDIALHSAWPGWTGLLTTSEANYTGYNAAARKTINRATGAGGLSVAGRSITFASDVDMYACSGGAGQNIWFWSMAPTGQTGIWWAGAIGGSAPVGCAALTGAAIVYAPGHGLSAGQTVVFFAPVSGSLPGGITEGTIYYVIATGLTVDAFEISATSGGAAITFSSSGFGTCQYNQGFAVVNGYTPRLKSGTIIQF